MVSTTTVAPAVAAVLFVAVPIIAWALVLITIPIAVFAGRRSTPGA